MKKIKVAVLIGGISAEREVSLASSRQVIKALKKSPKYQVSVYDPKTDLVKLIQDKNKIDVALPILHGPYGEDGTIQGFLELLKIPYAFSGVLPSALGMNKLISRRIFEREGLPVPKYQAVVSRQKAVVSIDYPLVIKPNTQGSSVGVSICQNEKELQKSLKKAFQYDKIVIVEEYIKGKEIAVGVLGTAENPKPLPVVEIIPQKEFFNFKAKYDGSTKEIVPARISQKLTKEAQGYAQKAHRTLGCSGATRCDMIIENQKSKIKNQIYVLEINTIPGFTEESLLPKAAKAAGISFEELLAQLLEIAKVI